MIVEGKLKNSLYKLKLLSVKILPFFIAGLYFLSTIFDSFSIDSVILNYITFFILYLFLYLSSYIFKFCAYHRMPLHYILSINCLSIYDAYIGIPLNEYHLFQFYIILTGIFIAITVYLHVKNNKKITSEIN